MISVDFHCRPALADGHVCVLKIKALAKISIQLFFLNALRVK